jgi:predicted phage tail protein
MVTVKVFVGGATVFLLSLGVEASALASAGASSAEFVCAGVAQMLGALVTARAELCECADELRAVADCIEPSLVVREFAA